VSGRIKGLTNREALRTHCWECGALPGKRCTYVNTVQYITRKRRGVETTVPHHVRNWTDEQRLLWWLKNNAKLLVNIG